MNEKLGFLLNRTVEGGLHESAQLIDAKWADDVVKVVDDLESRIYTNVDEYLSEDRGNRIEGSVRLLKWISEFRDDEGYTEAIGNKMLHASLKTDVASSRTGIEYALKRKVFQNKETTVPIASIYLVESEHEATKIEIRTGHNKKEIDDEEDVSFVLDLMDRISTLIIRRELVPFMKSVEDTYERVTGNPLRDK